MSENEYDIQSTLRNCLVEFMHECCERINSEHQFFEFLTQKSLLVWKYFCSKYQDLNFVSLESSEIRSCLRDLLLAQLAGYDNKAFGIIDKENTPILVKQVICKKWRHQQIAGKNARPDEVVQEFYSVMTASKKWIVYKGYTRLSSWLPIYLHAFLRDSLNQGMRNSESDTIDSDVVKKNPRDRRHISFVNGQEIAQESDPQKNLALKNLKNVAQNIFSQLSPQELQFLCLLRAKRNEGHSQKEIAQSLGIADYKLTRMKTELHKRFFDLLTKKLQTLFPTWQIESLHEQMTMDDLLGLLDEETVGVHDVGNSSDEKTHSPITPHRRTASAVRCEQIE